MNLVIESGRLTADPQVRLYGDNNDKKSARYTLAVDRNVKRDPNNPDQQTADFISCLCYGYAADFADTYLRKGMKILINGHITTGRYQNKDGQTVYTTDVVVDRHEFCESKSTINQTVQTSPEQAVAARPQHTAKPQPKPSDDVFINIPEHLDIEVPFE